MSLIKDYIGQDVKVGDLVYYHFNNEVILEEVLSVYEPHEVQSPWWLIKTKSGAAYHKQFLNVTCIRDTKPEYFV
jgi:hypothetical protein